MVFRLAEYVFEDCFGVWRYPDAQAITFSRIWLHLRVYRPSEYVFEDYFGAPWHVDVQELISLQIIVCSAISTVPGGFFDSLSTYFSARHADAPQTVSSQIIACSATLSVSGSICDLLSTFLRIIAVYSDTLMLRWRFTLNLSVPTTRKDPHKTTFPKNVPLVLQYRESRGMNVGYLLESGTGCALAASAPACCFSAGRQ